MKKKFQKQYDTVQKKAVDIILEHAENPDAALAKLKLLPRKDRRLIQREVRKKNNKENKNAATD